MVRMINGWTGTEMFVAEDRKDEYLAAGHRLAAEAPAPKKAEPVKEEPKKAAPVKAPAKKSTRRK